jgi:hypothetical protein
VSFLRRILGGGGGGGEEKPGGTAVDPGAGTTVEDEVERDRRLVREDAEHLDNELIQRQLRYADRKWVPPVQGGPRRSDDEEGKDH